MPDDTQTRVSDSLKTKVGPLPAWGWGLVLVSMTGAFWYLRHRNNTAVTLPVGAGTVSSTGAYGNGGFGSGGGGASGGASGSAGNPQPGGNTGGATGNGSNGSGPGNPGTNPSPTPSPTPTPSPAPTPTPTPAPGGTTPFPTPSGSGATIPPKPGPNYHWDGHAWVQDFIPIQPKLAGTPANALPTEAGTWAVPPSSPIPSTPGLQGPAPATRSLINIPQTSLTPGRFNTIQSPGGIVGGLEGWTLWAQLPSGNWQQWNEGEYIPQGMRLGVLPRGLSLPGGLTAREDRPNYPTEG